MAETWAKLTPYIIGALSMLALILGAWVFKKHPTDLPDEEKKAVEKETVEKEKVLEDQAHKDKAVLEDAHVEVVDKNVEALKEKTPELLSNPDELNNLLLLTGKDVRGRPE